MVIQNPHKKDSESKYVCLYTQILPLLFLPLTWVGTPMTFLEIFPLPNQHNAVSI